MVVDDVNRLLMNQMRRQVLRHSSAVQTANCEKGEAIEKARLLEKRWSTAMDDLSFFQGIAFLVHRQH